MRQMSQWVERCTSDWQWSTEGSYNRTRWCWPHRPLLDAQQRGLPASKSKCSRLAAQALTCLQQCFPLRAARGSLPFDRKHTLCRSPWTSHGKCRSRWASHPHRCHSTCSSPSSWSSWLGSWRSWVRLHWCQPLCPLSSCKSMTSVWSACRGRRLARRQTRRVQAWPVPATHTLLEACHSRVLKGQQCWWL